MQSTRLINPRALQWTLTNACKSGDELPVFDPAAHLQNGDGGNGESNGGNANANAADADASNSESSSIHGAILMTKDGTLVSQSASLDARAAALTSGLVSTIWRQQQMAAASAAATSGAGNGDLEYILMK